MIQDACDCWRFGCQKHLQSSTMFEKRNDDSARMSVKRRPSMQRPIPLQVVKLFLQNLRLEPWSPFNLWRAEPGPRKRSVCPAHPGTPQNWERKHELFKEPKKAYWQSKYWPSDRVLSCMQTYEDPYQNDQNYQLDALPIFLKAMRAWVLSLCNFVKWAIIVWWNVLK
jgi:hypothetical protein